MKNIWFTIYSSPKHDNKYIGLNNYRTLLEFLLIPAIQDKINRNKKIQKIMFCLIPELEKDLIDNFKSNYSNKRIVNGGIINLEASSSEIDWNNLSVIEKKDFLIKKWKVLFDNLSEDYFITDKSEVLKSLDKLKNQEWRITNTLFKKKIKYNKETYNVVMDISTESAQLALVRDSDEKWITLKNYETWQIETDANFKNFKFEDDILTFVNKNLFSSMLESPVVFNLKEILK
ncbi:hypothetical protein D1632_17315 [Chryseobacterium nematophagum]|uniref:Uncharacterized protein n=1 Tax=Chryseobacterium nematophagum TaxID=2305228 RepID=A0A3M7L7X3_9FLAO|nr:hypothetical protein [Chryseobacterium nematophagum]RMZ58050.1 hypothetical protein D1632_17315 [Chryseobacterium nematophagum]